MVVTAIEAFDPTSPLKTRDEDDVASYFESNLSKTFWDNPQCSTINRPTLLREIRRINFKLRHVTLKTILKAEKVYRSHIASSIRHHAKTSVVASDVGERMKISDTFFVFIYNNACVSL